MKIAFIGYNSLPTIFSSVQVSVNVEKCKFKSVER